MAVFQVTAKNRVEIAKKPRVYFTCHPADFEEYFSRLCADLWKTQDCAVYYTQDLTEPIPDSDLETDLGRCNLLIVPVTAKLLKTPNRAMDRDIPYAISARIPVLPIMAEDGLDTLYSQADKFGEKQYLKLHSSDVTEITYEQKLQTYLDSVLTDGELAQRIRSAFDAYIFLSYRKKDRRFANALMRRIHAHPDYHNIAIWFDEFLTPGESFRENIEKLLDSCRLFTLLVTPRLLEKVPDEAGGQRDNYVISTELPLARQKQAEKGTDILAVEMEKTDNARLLALDLADRVSVQSAAFDDRLTAAAGKLRQERKHTPEQDFLLGMAYFDGIDMEVDRSRGAALIEKAANSNHIEAIQKMVALYEHGIYLSTDLPRAISWQNRLILALEKQYKKPRSPEALDQLFRARYHCAVLYANTRQYSLAAQKIKKFLPELKASRTKDRHVTQWQANLFEHVVTSHLFLGDMALQQGDLKVAEDYFDLTKALYKDFGFSLSNEEDELYIQQIISQYMEIDLHLAGFALKCGDYEAAARYAKDALLKISQHIPDTGRAYDLRAAIQANEMAGDALFRLGQYEEAGQHYLAMHGLALQEAREKPSPMAQRDLAFACNRVGDYLMQAIRFKEAKPYYQQSRRISAAQKAPNYADEENLAFCDTRLGDLCWYRNMHPQIPYYYYKKAFRRRMRLLAEYPCEDAKKHLAYSYFNLARVSLFLRRYYFNKAKALFAQLIAESPQPALLQQEWQMLEKRWKERV